MATPQGNRFVGRLSRRAGASPRLSLRATRPLTLRFSKGPAISNAPAAANVAFRAQTSAAVCLCEEAIADAATSGPNRNKSSPNCQITERMAYTHPRESHWARNRAFRLEVQFHYGSNC